MNANPLAIRSLGSPIRAQIRAITKRNVPTSALCEGYYICPIAGGTPRFGPNTVLIPNSVGVQPLFSKIVNPKMIGVPDLFC